MPPPLARVLLPRRARRAGSITVAVAPVAVTAVAVTAVAVPVVTVAVARVAFPTAMVAVAVPRFPVRRHRGARRGAGWKSATKYGKDEDQRILLFCRKKQCLEDVYESA